MRNLFILTLLLNISFMHAQEQTVYDFEVETIDGEIITLEQFKGQKIIIVNTASKCGFTPQFEKLEQVYQKYKNQGLVIVGFPSNDFMNQDPGTNEEIFEFCTKNYGVSFLMMAKINVKGKNIHPLYNYLTTGELNGYKDNKVQWNFQKYLINESGTIARIAPSKMEPNDPFIIEWIEN